MLHLTILSRRGCHLCEVVHRIALHLQGEFEFEVSQLDIDLDQRFAALYGDRIPVVLIDHKEICSGTITEGDLRRALKNARRSRPISRILSRLIRTIRRQ